MITIERYGRFWAVYLDKELICLTVYRRGATTLKELIEGLSME